jgi:Kef-type K+ transport system membrane component KefB/Trk K+ transport system NAD-binding subunit
MNLMDLLIPALILDFNFLPLLFVVAIAWLIPMVLTVLKADKIPSVLLEIVAGYVAGIFLMKYVDADSMIVLNFLALSGLIFIMFLSGLEIDINSIIASFPKKIRLNSFAENPLLAGTAHYLICLFLSLLGTYLLSFYVEIPNVWFFALILTTTFMGIVYPVLKSRGETKTYYGQTLITTSAVADIFSITLVTISSLYLKFGFHYQLFLVIVFFLFFIILYYIGKKFSPGIFKKITYQKAHSATQLSLRGALALVLLFVVIAQFVGGEVVILGAFLSGLLMSFFMSKERSILIIKLEGMGFGFFIPVFFIMVGAKFDPGSLKEYGSSIYIFLIFLVILFYAVKIIPSFIWIKRFGKKLALAAGFLLAARLGLVIAAAQVGLQLGAITRGADSSFIIMVVITCIVSPLIYNLINRKKDFSDDHTVIVGGSSVGVLLSRRLKMLGKSSVIIEINPVRYDEIKKNGLDIIPGDGMDPGIYQKVNLKSHCYVVVITNNERKDLEICEMLRKELHHERIISIPGNSKIEDKMKALGVQILDARRVVASTIENLILRPGAYQSLIETFEEFSVEDITVLSDIEGKKIMDIPLHKDAMIMLLTRGNEKFVPHGNTYLKPGDIMTIFGTGSAIEEIRKLISRN